MYKGNIIHGQAAAYITFFNTARPAYSLKYHTPQQYKEAYAPKGFSTGVSAGN
jgi:putative transposase